MSIEVGELLYRHVTDPRNITPKEWADPVVSALYDALDPEEWAAAKAEATARAIDSGRIVTGPGQHRTGQGVRRRQRLISQDNGFDKE